jgi:hypothetical protein
MAEEGKAAEEVAPNKAAPKAQVSSQRKVVKCKNICNHVVSTSKGSIEPGKSGECTVAELRQLHRYLK